MNKSIKKTINKAIAAFKHHILDDVLAGNFRKPWHFLTVGLKHKLFSYPYVAVIETGNFCNLRCPTCPTPGHKIYRKRELMSFENFKKVVDNIKNSVHIVFLYNSGEPLLHPDIARMADYAHQNNLYTLISTNATLLNEKKTEELLNSGLDKIILCLDGMSRESYDAFRKGANFETVIRNIRYFCERKQALGLKKPFIELQFILTKLNQNEIKQVREFTQMLKVDKLHIKRFALGEYAYSKEEIQDLSERFLPDKQEVQNRVIYKTEEDGAITMKNSPLKCKCVNAQMIILADGNVSMCCYDLNGQYVYGNVFNHKLKDIWFSKHSKSMRKSAENRIYPLCKICCIFNS